jgi:hypothetical protein
VPYYTQAGDISRHASLKRRARKHRPVLRCKGGIIDHPLMSPSTCKLCLRRPFESKIKVTQHASFVHRSNNHTDHRPSRNKRSTSFKSTVGDVSSDFLSRSRDTVGQKVFINFLGCITLRSTLGHAAPFGVNDTADYMQGSVNSLVIVLGGDSARSHLAVAV